MSPDRFKQLLQQVLVEEIGPITLPPAQRSADKLRADAEREQRERQARRNYHLRRFVIRRVLGIGRRKTRRIQVRPGQNWLTWGDQC